MNAPGDHPPQHHLGWGQHVPAALAALALLLGLQLLGTLLVDLTGLPVPGAVLGLVLLLAVGARHRGLVARAQPAADPLLRHLQLLFVPPGVGALTQLSEIAEHAAPLAVAVVGSFAVGLVVAGALLQALLRRRAGGPAGTAAGEAA
ncbi:CidA/LrgA family protein [Kineococcus indalonis]|uniref:CidA/LrgA family protein n=1 Tax=Kineococcus indalonis TaxID=2696566 RepID=UPI001412DCC2|nr:CidA/LrgA family protein [Kineococcus indalonis]NAZ88566.1 CidA/LrgA family protein [Kineococcus indalonis]